MSVGISEQGRDPEFVRPVAVPVSRGLLALGAILRDAALPIAAVTAWIVLLADADATRMTDLGLVSIVPAPLYAVIVALLVGFVAAIRGPVRRRSAVLHLSALFLILYASPLLVEEHARFAVSWRHAGITDHILQGGAIDPRVDAYFNWPGFFMFGALLTAAVGAPTSAALLDWAPLLSNALYLVPAAAIARSASADERVAWGTVGGLMVTNWVGQDYFSPQGLNYLWYLTLLAVLLTAFRSADGSRPLWGWIRGRVPRVARLADPLARRLAEPDGRMLAVPPATRAGLLLAVVVIHAASVASHQLTPFFILFTTTALVVLLRLTTRGLPILMGAMIAGWMVLMAVTWLSGHLPELAAELGQIGGNLGESTAGRLQGSAEHLAVLTVRILLTLGVWGLAFLAALRRLRAGVPDTSMALLVAVPFSLVALQGYGGEMLLRVYLFTLVPALFLLMAGILFGAGRRLGLLRTVTLVGMLAAFSFAFLVSRYGNERMDRMSPQDIAAVQELYRIAPRGSTLVAVVGNLPWKSQGYTEYEYVGVLDPTPRAQLSLDLVLTSLRAARQPAYLIVTPSQGAAMEVFRGAPVGQWDTFVAGLRASPSLSLVYANGGAAIFRYDSPSADASVDARVRP
jgi:hypothetical protein